MDTKIKLGIIAATVLILSIGIFLMSGKKERSTENLVREYSHQTDSSASATLVEFSDFQCPACVSYFPIVKQVLSSYQGKLNFVYRHFPLTQHKNALPAAYASEAAGMQGKFWEMYEKLFDKHSEWENEQDPRLVFEKYAEELGLDKVKFNEDAGSEEVKKIVDTDYNDGMDIGVNYTPSFYINGKLIDNPPDADSFIRIIGNELE